MFCLDSTGIGILEKDGNPLRLVSISALERMELYSVPSSPNSRIYEKRVTYFLWGLVFSTFLFSNLKKNISKRMQPYLSRIKNSGSSLTSCCRVLRPHSLRSPNPVEVTTLQCRY